ncbi:nucleoside deaminase [Agromyces intestinalis]|uniref:Nucleoside deaminase n=1 Tax=Agromyces intestinalis TaxID=2592652 RepID=A0A5C1YFP0_9MICO|nr:nucleoside deaminase [Agromyces intestinalis]QEO13582.1 nucleoside deaminase [Agromyces intestinalis]
MDRPNEGLPLGEHDRGHLRRCVELAREALEAGDEPFGSLLVDASGVVRFEDRNREGGGDATAHPELAIAQWAAAELTPDERRASVVYTSGEHCPMCSAAHAWVGLGRIVYAASTAQFSQWRREEGLAAGPVAALPVTVVAPGVPVAGPDPELSAEVHELYLRMLRRDRS